MDIEEGITSNNTELLFKEAQPSLFGIMAAKIAYYNFEWRFLTVVMFNSVDILGLQSFLINYKQSVVVKLGRFVHKKRFPVPQFVIFGEETSEIATTIRWLVRVKYDNTAKFIIICTSHEMCDENLLFATVSQFNLLNVIFLKSNNVRGDPQAYTYYMVSPTKCRNSDPIKLDITPDCPNDTCFETLFPEKLSNLYKCHFTVSTVEQPPFMFLNDMKMPSGTEGEIIKLAADMLNATLVIITPQDGNNSGHFTNENWTGSLGDVFNSRALVSMCATPLTWTKNGNFQISFTYYSMDMVWVAKLPSEMASWEKLLHPLNFKVRIVLLFMFTGIIFMNTIKDTKRWQEVRKVFRIGPSKYNMLFYSWILFLGMPIHIIPRKRIFCLMVFIWIWSCFVIRSAYQAALINSLKYPLYLQELETFNDIRKAGYSFGGPLYLRDYYFEDREVYDNWIALDLDAAYETLDDILEGTSDLVLAANKEIVKYRLMKHYARKQLQVIPEKIVNSPTVMYLQKYSPMAPPLSYVLRVALEGGFVQRCYGKYVYDNRKHFRHNEITESLNLHHFGGCFAVLIIGWFLSIVYFVVEVICGHLHDE